MTLLLGVIPMCKGARPVDHFTLAKRPKSRANSQVRGMFSNDCFGSNASVGPSWHVGFTPDSGRIAARQRTDASGQKMRRQPHSDRFAIAERRLARASRSSTTGVVQIIRSRRLLVASSAEGIVRPSIRSRLGVDDKFELGRLHDGQISRLGALQNFSCMDTDLPKHVSKV